jgi:hypothetical protein
VPSDAPPFNETGFDFILLLKIMIKQFISCQMLNMLIKRLQEKPGFSGSGAKACELFDINYLPLTPPERN